MNCKPGDLAIIIKSSKLSAENDGKIVQVIDTQKCDIGEWRCLPLTSVIGENNQGIIGPSKPGEHVWFMDFCLRPIRDPGDDATDEMILRLGSPNKQEQTA